MLSFDRMPIRRKVQYALAMALLPLVIVLGATLWTVNTSRNSNSAITGTVIPHLLTLSDLREKGTRLIEALDNLALLATVLHDEPATLADISGRQRVPLDALRANFVVAFGAFKSLPAAEEVDTAPIRRDIAAAAQQLMDLPETVVATLASRPAAADILKLRRQFKEKAFQFRRLVDGAVAAERSRLAASGGDLQTAIDRTVVIVVAGLLLSIFAYALGAGHLGHHILEPLVRLRDAAILLGGGDFSAPLRVETRDELGTLVQSFIDMRARLERQTQLQIGIFDAVGEGICVFDNDMQLQTWNRTYDALLEFPEGFLKVGTAFDDILRLRARRGEYGARQPEEAISAELAAARTDSTAPSDHVTLSGRILERRRRPMPQGGWVTLFRDITERRQAELATLAAKDAAEHANRVKSQFLANMSHELRTPLNAIIGFTEIIQQESFGPLGDKRYKEYADDILDGGRRLLANLTNIMDAVRVEGGEFTLNEDWIDVAELVSAVTESFDVQIATAKLSIDVKLPPWPIEVKGDERVLRRVLSNLLSNAVKFTPPDGRVCVSVAQSEGSVEFTVRDNGIGIRRNDLQKVAAMFEQADGSLNRRYEGLGLGVPLSKALVELHGGQLLIDSEPSRGTSIVVRLPADRVRSPPALLAAG